MSDTDIKLPVKPSWWMGFIFWPCALLTLIGVAGMHGMNFCMRRGWRAFR